MTLNNLRLLLQNLVIVHAKMDNTIRNEDVTHYETLMLQNLSQWALPCVNQPSSIEFQLYMLAQLFRFNEMRLYRVSERRDLDRITAPKQTDNAPLALKIAKSLIAKMELEDRDYAITSLTNDDRQIDCCLLGIVSNLGGMGLLVRVQLIISAWAVLLETMPIVVSRHGNKPMNEIIKLGNELLCESVLTEDVPAMIQETAEHLLTKLGLTEPCKV